MKRLLALLLTVCLIPVCALGDMAWPDAPTQGQAMLRTYIDGVNANLALLGQPPVNALYECYPGFAVLGVTAETAAEMIPEGVELTFTLYEGSINTLQLRVSDADRFAAVAAACLQAAAPALPLQEAQEQPAAYAARVKKEPHTSFADEVVPLNGETVRAYYAYYPNQYADGVNWLQLTLVFPLAGAGAGDPSATPTPPPGSDDTEYAGFFSQDDFTHLEVFTTPTPEPDSAAAE